MLPIVALLSESKRRRYQSRRAAVVIAVLMVLSLSAPAALGQSDNWNGGAGNWSNGGAWSIGVPAPANNVVIYSGGNDLVTLDVGSTTINSLTLGGASNGTTSELTDAGVTQALTISNGLTVGQTGVLNLSGGSTLTAGANSTNAGSIGLSNNSNLSIAADLRNDGNINAGANNVSVSGTFDNYGTAGSAADGTFTAGLINNYGLIDLGPASQLSAGSINNSGLIIPDIFDSFFTTGDFNNNSGGQVRLGLGTFMNVGGNFNNHGLLNIAGGSAGKGAAGEVGGAFNNYGDGTVNVEAETSGNLEVSGQFTNAGAVTLAGHGTLNADGGFLNNGTLAVTQHGGLTTNWFSNAGDVFIRGNGIGFGTLFTVTGTFNNTGTVDLAGSIPLSCGGCGGDTLSAAWFNNSGSVMTAGTETVNVTNTYNQTGGSTTIQQNGILAAGLFTQSDGIVQVDGTLTAAGLTQSSGAGLLMGRGTINGNVSIGGTIMPGVMGDPGVFTINGSYTQTSSGIYNELINNAGNGLLMVNGPATLGPGTKLFVTLLGGFAPAPGTNYTILDYSSESGTLVITDPIFNNGTERWVITSYNGGDGDDIVLTAENNPTPTPEPASFLLLATGIAVMAAFIRYRRTAV